MKEHQTRRNVRPETVTQGNVKPGKLEDDNTDNLMRQIKSPYYTSRDPQGEANYGGKPASFGGNSGILTRIQKSRPVFGRHDWSRA